MKPEFHRKIGISAFVVLCSINNFKIALFVLHLLLMLISTFFNIVLVFFTSVLYTEGEAFSLQINISNMEERSGVIRIAVYDDENAFPEEHLKAIALKEILISDEMTVISTEVELKAGNYAVSLFQDLNHNGKLDKGLFGIPKEPWGCSGESSKGTPAFERSSFFFNADMKIDVTLNNQ
ncbi:MAG: DUF2141 domain-containing protein [Chitinophagales bacterium]|nr:DUF2141 domain-containing protein [Chitinophagales bacterium]